MKLLLKLLPNIAALLILATGEWMWQANSYGTIIDSNEATHQEDIAKIAYAGTA